MLQYLSDRMFDQIRGQASYSSSSILQPVRIFFYFEFSYRFLKFLLQGWTYGVSSRISVSTGRVYVNFYRASDLANAYPFFREMVSNYTRTKDPLEWDKVLLDSAVSSKLEPPPVFKKWFS